MKRTVVITFIAMLLFCTVAHAGFFGSITDKLSGITVRVAVEAAFVISMLFGLAKWRKYKKTITEAIELGLTIRAAMDDGSPGGTTITKAEFDKILKAGGEVGQAILAVRT